MCKNLIINIFPLGFFQFIKICIFCRSYLGITVHWINSETLKRESAALACRRIRGKHTHDILAKAIHSICLEYHIQNKICCTTTDNGSNFVKAFR